jgi:hypothetical protein
VDAGTYDNEIGYELYVIEDDVENYLVQCHPGTVTINKRPAVIISDTQEQVYNGTALENGDYYQNGFIEGENVEVTVTGSQTDVGTSDNTFTYTAWEGTNLDNYDITATFGTLTVTRRPVTFTSASEEKTYDGTPLMNDNVTFPGDGLVSGDGFTFKVTGTQTEAGSSENTFTYTPNAGTNADNYDITTEFGTLKINPRSVTLTS